MSAAPVISQRLCFMINSLSRAVRKSALRCATLPCGRFPSWPAMPNALGGIGAREHEREVIHIRAEVLGQRVEPQAALDAGQRVRRADPIERLDQRDAIECA